MKGPTDNSPPDQGNPASLTPPELASPPGEDQQRTSPADAGNSPSETAPAEAPAVGTAAGAPPPPAPAAAPVTPGTKTKGAKSAAELERIREQTRARVQRFREKTGKKAPAADEGGEEKKAPAKELSAKEQKTLERDLRLVIDALWLLVQMFAPLFKRQAEDLTDQEIGDGTRAWMPVAEKHPWLVKVGSYLTAPLWLVTIIKRKVKRRAERKAEEQATKPADLVPPAPAAAPAAVTPAPGNVVTLRPSAAAAALAEEQAREAEGKGS